MRLVPRLLPTVIAVATLTLTVRIGALWHDAGVAFAEATPAASGSPGTGTPLAAPSSGDAAGAAPAGDAAAGGDAAKAHASPQKFSPAEVQVLSELSKRRDELDKRGEDLDHRELLLKAAEQRVDEKIAQLKTMQAAVDGSINQMKQQDDARIESLVHIYENMKPKDAATIFEGMDLPAVIGLLTHMKDLKTAPILAAMAPDKARAITVALEQRKEVPDPKAN